MRRWFQIALWLAVGGLVLLAVRQLLPNDEKRIRKTLLELADKASAPGSGRALDHLAAAAEVAAFFAPQFEINIETTGVDLAISERAELIQTVVSARSLPRSARIEFLDIVVNVGTDNKVATAELTARVAISGERDSIVAELRFEMIKLERRWLIRRIETMRTFQ
jgi:hypothetical protein